MVKLIFPCDYIGITSGFKSSHKAIDLGWSKSRGGPNHKILAPADGKIVYVKNNYKTKDSNGNSYGNYVKISHTDGISTLLAHLKYNSINVKVGDKVKKGQTIGIMGDTGYATGIHCHYEVRINNDKVNPLKYTYALQNQYIGANTKLKYKPLILKGEDSDMNEINDDIIDDSVVEDDVIFEYVCNKTGMYKIQLNENEKLVIKD